MARFIWAIWNSHSKSDTIRRPWIITEAPWKDIIYQQPVKGVNRRLVVIRQNLPDESDPLLDRKKCLFCGILGNRDNHHVNDPQAAVDDIEMAKGYGVK